MVKQQLWQQINLRALLAALLVSVGLVLGFVTEASAVTCRNIVNPAEATRWDDGTRLIGASPIYTVPGSGTSGCIHINVKNITLNASVTSPHCNNFRVRFYPTSGGQQTTSWVWRCSTPPDGAVVAVATDVINGTRYRMEYETRWNYPPLQYTIRD